MDDVIDGCCCCCDRNGFAQLNEVVTAPGGHYTVLIAISCEWVIERPCNLSLCLLEHLRSGGGGSQSQFEDVDLELCPA